jgi:4-amino-4-deoxychorismate lyase
MFRLIESLKIQDGQLFHIEYHQERMSRSMKNLFNVAQPVDIAKAIEAANTPTEGLYKCRVIYSDKIHKVEFHPYQKRSVNSIKLVRDNEIEYDHKYEDRKRLNELFDLRGECDDIIIIKNGFVTDASSSNVALLKNGQWYTPSSYLLPGTKRANLIKNGNLVEKEISEDGLFTYEKVCLINAMVDLMEGMIPTEQVVS